MGGRRGVGGVVDGGVEGGAVCPRGGPDLCPAQCFLAPGQLEWCDDEPCTTVLETGDTYTTSFSTTGDKEVWLRAYDSNGQWAAVPTRVEIVE